MTIKQRTRVHVPLLNCSFTRNRVLSPGTKLNVIRRQTNEDDLHWAFEISHETWEVINADQLQVTQTWSNKLYPEPEPPISLREDLINMFVGFSHRTLIGVFYKTWLGEEGSPVDIYWEPTLHSRSKR